MTIFIFYILPCEYKVIAMFLRNEINLFRNLLYIRLPFVIYCIYIFVTSYIARVIYMVDVISHANASFNNFCRTTTILCELALACNGAKTISFQFANFGQFKYI